MGYFRLISGKEVSVVSPIERHTHHVVHHHEEETPAVAPHELDPPNDTVQTSSQTAKPKTLLDSLLTSQLTIGSYTDLVQIPKSKNKETLFQNDEELSSNHNKLLQNSTSFASSVQAIKGQISDISTQQTSLSATETSQIGAVNQLIQDYNSQITPTDTAEISALNDLTPLYNAGVLDQATYQSIVTAYNAYATARNVDIQASIDAYTAGVTTYNGQVAANNVTAGTINTEGAPFNIPAFPNQPQATTESTALLPLFPLPLPTQQTNPNSPPPYLPANPAQPTLVDTRTPLTMEPPAFTSLPLDVFMNTYYQPIYNALSGGLTISNNQIDTAIATDDYRRNYLRNPNNIAAPDTIVDKKPLPPRSSPGTQGPGGVGLSLITNQTAKNLEKAISNTLYTSNNEQFNLHVTRALLGSIKNFSLITLHHLGLLATKPAAQALNLENLTPENAFSTFKVAAGVSVTSQITALVASGGTETAVKKLVHDLLEGQVDPAAEKKLVDNLTAQLNVALLQQAATGASIALSAPGLNSQLAANVTGLSGKNTAASLTPDEILSDSVKLNFFTTTLAGSLASTGVGSSNALTIIDTATQAALASGQENFHKVLVDQLLKQGLDQAEASRLADQAGIILGQEAEGTRVLHSQLLNSASDISLLSQQLQIVQGLNQTAALAAATQAINQVLQNQSISSDAEFRAALQIQLQSQGIGSASKIASNVVTGVTAAAGQVAPLENPEPEQPLQRHQLRAQIARHVTQLLADPLGSDVARRHAHRVVDILVGAPGSDSSLLAQLDRNVARLAQLQGGDTLQKSFRDFISPNIDAFVFNNKILDPANTFFLSAMTSTRLTDMQQPKNYIRYLEFYV